MILSPRLQNTSPWLHDINRLFDFAFRNLNVQGPSDDLRIYEDDDGFAMELDMPGVSRDDLELERFPRKLVLRVGKDDEDGQRIELPLSENVDSERIGARLEHGVLTLSLPKVDRAAQTRHIEIQ